MQIVWPEREGKNKLKKSIARTIAEWMPLNGSDELNE